MRETRAYNLLEFGERLDLVLWETCHIYATCQAYRAEADFQHHHDLKLLQRPSSSLEIPVEDEQSVCPRTQRYPSMGYFTTLLSPSDDKWLYYLDSGKEDLDIAARSGPVKILGAEDMRRSFDDSSEDTYGKAPTTDLNDIVFRYSCHEKLVSTQMPRPLLSLPEVLISNPTNLLYFHHFVDNTASLLVGYDCLCNPFRSILPRSKI